MSTVENTKTAEWNQMFREVIQELGGDKGGVHLQISETKVTLLSEYVFAHPQFDLANPACDPKDWLRLAVQSFRQREMNPEKWLEKELAKPKD